MIASAKKNYINNTRSTELKEGVLFVDFIERVIKKRSKRKSYGSLSNYKTLITHLNKFSEESHCELFTNSINEEFLDDFISYLEYKDLRLNYIKNILTLIKAMIKKAAFYGYIIDYSYDEVDVKEEESFAVYLSMNEITRIYYYQNLTRKQQRIRDLFIVGCLTALRYSDYSTLNKDNFKDGFIVKIQKKTGKKVIVPVHDYVKEIYDKYEGDISSRLSIQHFNRYMKMISKKIGLNEEINFTYTKGGKTISETKEKWELISSHTARRSAATNMYLTGRMKTYEIMKLTGHTTERSFFKYIKIIDSDIAKQLSSDNYFRI